MTPDQVAAWARQAVSVGASSSLVSFGRWQATVQSDLPALHDQLRQRLPPFYPVRDGAPDRPSDVMLQVALGDAPTPEGPGTAAMLRYSAELPSHRRPTTIWPMVDGSVVREDRSGDLIVMCTSTRRILVVGADPASVAKNARRIVQDLVRLHAWSDGLGIFEASAIRLPGGRTVVVAGGSGAGKTTFGTRLLQVNGAGFLANDEVMLEPNAAHVVVHGSPVHVMVRRWLAERTPQLRDLRSRYDVEQVAKISVHYADYAARFGAPLVVSAPADLLVFLTAGDGRTDLPADAAARRLADCALWTDSWATPLRALLSGSTSGALPVLVERIASSVPARIIGRDGPLELLLSP